MSARGDSERDVVERLEEWDAHATRYGVDHRLVRAAAAEIRALRAERNRLRKALEEIVEAQRFGDTEDAFERVGTIARAALTPASEPRTQEDE